MAAPREMATPNETVVMADEADMPGNAVTVPSRITNKKLPLARSRAGGWLCPRVYRTRVTPTLGGLGCSIWCRRGRCAAHARPEPARKGEGRGGAAPRERQGTRDTAERGLGGRRASPTSTQSPRGGRRAVPSRAAPPPTRCSPLRSRRGPRAACIGVPVNTNGRALGGRASDVGTSAGYHRERSHAFASRLMNKRSRAFDEGPARERR